jgi:hypothetical protein
MKLNVGDCIERPGDALELVCEIIEVRPTGYTWRYLRRSDRVMRSALSVTGRYQSEFSGDPFFDQGWSLVDRDSLSVPGTDLSRAQPDA